MAVYIVLWQDEMASHVLWLKKINIFSLISPIKQAKKRTNERTNERRMEGRKEGRNEGTTQPTNWSRHAEFPRFEERASFRKKGIFLQSNLFPSFITNDVPGFRTNSGEECWSSLLVIQDKNIIQSTVCQVSCFTKKLIVPYFCWCIIFYIDSHSRLYMCLNNSSVLGWTISVWKRLHTCTSMNFW